MLSEDTRVDVSGAACSKWHDEFNGTGWEVLCCNRQSQQNWQYECCQTQKRAHKSSTLVCSGCYNVCSSLLWLCPTCRLEAWSKIARRGKRPLRFHRRERHSGAQIRDAAAA